MFFLAPGFSAGAGAGRSEAARRGARRPRPGSGRRSGRRPSGASRPSAQPVHLRRHVAVARRPPWPTFWKYQSADLRLAQRPRAPAPARSAPPWPPRASACRSAARRRKACDGLGVLAPAGPGSRPIMVRQSISLLPVASPRAPPRTRGWRRRGAPSPCRRCPGRSGSRCPRARTVSLHALLELVEDVLDRVLELVGGRGGRRRGAVQLLGQLARDVEALVGLRRRRGPADAPAGRAGGRRAGAGAALRSISASFSVTAGWPGCAARRARSASRASSRSPCWT